MKIQKWTYEIMNGPDKFNFLKSRDADKAAADKKAGKDWFKNPRIVSFCCRARNRGQRNVSVIVESATDIGQGRFAFTGMTALDRVVKGEYFPCSQETERTGILTVFETD